MLRSLVTGGAGFLGSHLCDSLIADGHEVLCIDNLFTGHRNNIRHLEGNPRFRFIHHDVVAPYDHEVDCIWNLACPAAPGHYRYEPVKTLQTSVDGVLNALSLAKRTGARILHASTSEVYGDPDVHPQVESYRGNVNPIGPRACYDEGKRAAETLFFDYHRQHNLKIKVVRLFNTYGPRMHPHDGRVVSNFVVSALTGRPLTMYGEGQQTRSFCYVDDLIRGLVLMMQSDDSVIGPINLGNPGEFTISELAAEVIRQVGSDPGITYHPLPTDDPVRRQPDITRAKTTLGWEPRVQLREGLATTIDYFRGSLNL